MREFFVAQTVIQNSKKKRGQPACPLGITIIWQFYYFIHPYLPKIFLLRHNPKRQSSNIPDFLSFGLRLTGLKSFSFKEEFFSCKFLSFSRLFNFDIEHAPPVSSPAFSEEQAKTGFIPKSRAYNTADTQKIFFIVSTLSFVFYLLAFYFVILTIMIMCFAFEIIGKKYNVLFFL